jgi:hypothetical protein
VTPEPLPGVVTTARPDPAVTSPPPPPPVPSPAADVPVRSASLAAVEAQPVDIPPVHPTVPSLGIGLPIDPVGVAADGQMEIPPLAERAGWYRYGAAPGDADGTAVVAAHVDSAASAGVGPFARLAEVQPGAVVEVTLADGTSRVYAVTEVTRQPKPEIRWADVFVRDGAHRLVLITCGGTFQREAGRYSDNVVVTAQPVGG